jgi:hypothetical protein
MVGWRSVHSEVRASFAALVTRLTRLRGRLAAVPPDLPLALVELGLGDKHQE